VRTEKTRILAIADYLGRTNIHPIRPEAVQLFGAQGSGEFDITVICSPESVMVDYYRDNGLNVISYKIDKKLSVGAIRFIRQLIRDNGYSILHLFNSKAISNGAIAAIGLPIKVVAYRGQTGGVSRLDPFSYLNVLNPRIDKIICVSKSVENGLRRQLWGHKDRLVTIYKGHDISWYNNEPANLAELSLPDGAFLVAMTANLRPRKGLNVLMAATHFFPADLPIYVLLIGASPGDPKTRGAIAKAAVPGRVIPLGYRDDAPQVAGACAVAVLPTTKREGLSRAVLEAMAYGRPTVVSDTGGNAELVEDGVSGYVVPPGDPELLAEAILKLFNDPQKREQFGAEARRRLESRFSAREGIEKTLQVYRELIS
jgi:glycosyltransferase involved in cell wall biosynthesis